MTPADLPLRSSAGEPPKILLRDVHKAFGPKVVLDGLNLEIAAGESVVLIGGSGTGKSVLLKHIIGLLHPDSGVVEIDGVDLATLGTREITDFRRRFGMAFQEGALFDSMTVAQNVGFALKRHTDLTAAEVADRVEECLTMVRLGGVGEKMPSQLSGGMRRRVGFARAIALEPEILLFDEPTTGLDPITTALIDEVINELRDRLDITAVTITHDMISAFRISDRIGMLHEGRITAIAPPEEFRRLEDSRVQAFIQGRLADDEPSAGPDSASRGSSTPAAGPAVANSGRSPFDPRSDQGRSDSGRPDDR